MGEFKNFFNLLLEDQKYDSDIRSEAKSVFNKVSEWFIDNLETIIGTDQYHAITPDGEFLGFYTKATEDLTVIFNFKGNASYHFDPDSNIKFLQIPILNGTHYDHFYPDYDSFVEDFGDEEELKEELEDSFDSAITTFVHEYIHYKDYDRFKGTPNQLTKSAEKALSGDRKDYYDSNFEQNAYYQEGVSRIEDSGAIFPDFKSFLEASVRYFDNQYIMHVRSDEKLWKKFTKRLYQYFSS